MSYPLRSSRYTIIKSNDLSPPIEVFKFITKKVDAKEREENYNKYLENKAIKKAKDSQRQPNTVQQFNRGSKWGRGVILAIQIEKALFSSIVKYLRSSHYVAEKKYSFSKISKQVSYLYAQ